MTSLSDLLNEPVVSRLGWMLLHSVWLGMVVAFVIAILHAILPKRAAGVRYIAACFGMVMTAVLPVVALHFFGSPETGAKPLVALTPGDTPDPTHEPVTPTTPAVPIVNAPGRANVVLQSEPQTHDPMPPAPLADAPAPPIPWQERVVRGCQHLLPWLVAGWLMGVSFMSLRLLAGWIEVQRMKRRLIEPVSETLRRTLDDLGTRVGVSQPVRLLRSGLARVPMAMGWLRPVILLPASAMTGLTEEQLRAVIAHELAHIRRYDYLVNLLQSVIETLLFYHPAVWWLSHRIRVEREHCCDDIAVRVCGNRVSYARALTELEVLRCGSGFMAPAATSGSLPSRVRRLLNVPTARSLHSGRSLAGLLTVLVVIVIGMTVLTSPLMTLAEADDGTSDPVVSRKVIELADYKVEVSVTPGNAKPMLGEPVYLSLKATNLGDSTIILEHGGDSRGILSSRFSITAVDAEGRPVKDPHANAPNFGGPVWYAEIAPGMSYSEKVFLPLWCAFEYTGKHTVTCVRTLDLSSDKDGRSHQQHQPVELSCELDIQPYDRKAMGEVITQWGEQVSVAEKVDLVNACRALAYIDDKRVVPWLAEGVAKGDYTNKIPAIDGLAKHPTAASAEALTSPLRDMKDHAVREHAGRALARMAMQDDAARFLIAELETAQGEERAKIMTGSGHAGSSLAWDPLMSGIKDEDTSVRHAAAEALGVLGDPRAIAVLKGLLTDGDHGLRVAAVKGLLALDQPMRAEWLTPVIKATTDINDRNFHESIRLLQLYGKEQAAPGLVGCLHFDDPSPRNSFNMFLLQYIEASPNGPKYYYKFHHDPNTDGTPEQIENNRRILAELKQWLDDANAGAGVRGQPEWGEAVEGVKARLKPDQIEWRFGEVPTLKADLRNEGYGEYVVPQAQETCELEVDGIWHFWMGPVDVLESLLRANSEHKNIPVTLGEHWYPKDAAEAPKLEVGEHTVRLAFFLGRYHDLSEPRQFRVISNPVEIEILPAIADSEARLKPGVRDLARRAIEIEADNSPPFEGPDQRTTGLDLTPILKATGQTDVVRSFPVDRGKWETEIEQFGKEGKVWTLCALLDHAEADVKLGAARELSKRAGPEQVPVLLAAAKRNNYGVSGSENATIHALYRKYLKRGLERATSLALTPAGLTLVIYPPPGNPVTIRSEDNPAYFEAEVDFQKVDSWLRERFQIINSAETTRSQPATAPADSPEQPARLR